MRIPAPLPLRIKGAPAAAAAGLAALGLLAACTVGPNYTGPPKPETPNPASYKNAALKGPWKRAEPADKDPRGPWWEVFHDSDLTRLETAAIANNQDLRQSVARIEESRARTRVAAADFLPNAQFDATAMRERSSNTDPRQRAEAVGGLSGLTGASGGMMGSSATAGGSMPPLVITEQPLTRTFNMFRVPADLNWEIDLFGRVRRNYEAARAESQQALADAQNMKLSVAANVATGYYNLRALDAEIDVLRNTIKFRKDALYIAEERLQAGLSSELDVQRERAELAGNAADLAGVERVRAEMENALATLVGQPASTFHLTEHPLAASTPPRIPVGLPSRLLERRPDVAVAERGLAAANARIGIAVAAIFPRINLTGAGGFESASVSQLFTWQSSIWQIGPNVQLPIFEGGRNVANLRVARAQYAEGVANYRQQVLVAFQDVENALADLRLLAIQAAAQDEAVAAARRTLELSNKQFNKGAVTFLDVVDAERTVLSNERQAAQLLGQRMQATVELIKALGGGWS
jgi:multidrug efflux system outer membrane protein